MDLQTELDLGNQSYINKNYEQAIIHYDRLLAVYPDNFVVSHNKGLALTKLDMLDEAIPCLQLAMNNGYTESWLAYGSIMRNKGQYKDAMASFANAFLIDNEHSGAYSNYGNSLREFGKPEIAIPFFQLATKLNPADMTARLNLSVAYLMSSDLLNGWKYYDARWFYDSDTSFKPTLPGIEYDGTQDISDKVVFVYVEQGLGDCVQFGRYLNLLENQGAHVVFLCRKPLARFFRYNYPNIKIYIENESDLTDLQYHYHVPLMELPKCFNTTIDTIPGVNYSVDDDIISYWYKRLGPTNKKRIGIVWNSNRKNFINRFKNIELETLLKLKDDNIELISLEYDVSPEQTKLLQDSGVIVYGNELGDFYSVAGLMKNLDLVISIDTATVHLSASIGVHTWTLLSDYACDWRWFTNRDDSPFYSLMKLYRQKGKDWEGLIDQVKKDLKILDK
jgi:tetratricopeptide (TPR) repeat protein